MLSCTMEACDLSSLMSASGQEPKLCAICSAVAVVHGAHVPAAGCERHICTGDLHDVACVLRLQLRGSQCAAPREILVSVALMLHPSEDLHTGVARLRSPHCAARFAVAHAERAMALTSWTDLCLSLAQELCRRQDHRLRHQLKQQLECPPGHQHTVVPKGAAAGLWHLRQGRRGDKQGRQHL